MPVLTDLADPPEWIEPDLVPRPVVTMGTTGIDVASLDLHGLDGAFSLYLPVLKLLEPRLRGGTPILAENAWEHGNDYLDYVRDPANGYLSQPLPVTEGRGNEFTIVTR